MTKKTFLIPRLQMKLAKFKLVTVPAHMQPMIIITVPFSKILLGHRFTNINYTMCIFLIIWMAFQRMKLLSVIQQIMTP